MTDPNTTPQPPLASYIEGSPRLEAAFEIASTVHANEKRKHGGPYIEHPLLVCRLLDIFGCTDVQKAVGLLHDVGESCEEQSPPGPYTTADKLRSALINAIKKRTEGQISSEDQQWAKDVCRGVKELSNGSHLYEGKRTWQVDHADRISTEFKPVKILDQAASVIDGGILHYAMGRLRNEKGFGHKGRDVAVACSKDDPDNKFLGFYEGVFSYFKDIFTLAREGNHEAVEAKVSEFNIEQMVKDAIAGKFKAAPEPKKEFMNIYYQPKKTLERGLVRITISKTTGMVVGFGLIVTPGKEQNETQANIVASSFRLILESAFQHSDVETHPLKGPGFRELREQGLEQGLERWLKGISVRDFALKPPMPPDKFLSIASQVGAIDQLFITLLSAEAGIGTARIITGRNGHRGR